MNYAHLPDGTELKLRDGRTFIKGPHPVAEHVKVYSSRDIVGWQQGQETCNTPNWMAWFSDGSCPTESLEIVEVGVLPIAVEPTIDDSVVTFAMARRRKPLVVQMVERSAAQDDPTVKPAIPGLKTMTLSVYPMGMWHYRD